MQQLMSVVVIYNEFINKTLNLVNEYKHYIYIYIYIYIYKHTYVLLI